MTRKPWSPKKILPTKLGPCISTRPSGGVGRFRTSKVIWESPKSNVVCCTLGVSASSFQAYRLPNDDTEIGQPPRPSPHRQTSISCTPWLPMSPLPVSQNQCQLYANRSSLNGRSGAGPRNKSQLTPGGVGLSGLCPIDARRLKHRPFDK